MQNYYPLNFLKDPLREGVFLGEDKCVSRQKINNLGYKTYYFNSDFDTIINPKILRWAEKLKMPVNEVYIFVNDPYNEIQHTHIDPQDPNELCFAINWCISGHDSEMVWYAIKPEYSFNDVITGRSGPDGIFLDVEKLDLIERHRLQGPTLVNTSTPHGVFRYSSEPRLSVSIRFAHSFKTWSEVVKYFSPYIIK
jgi:hypothetical protein